MMIMTAKVNLKKIAIVLAAAVGVILTLVLLLGRGGNDAPTMATISDNDSRVKFLTDLGWEVSASPVESGQVRLPKEQTDVYSRYNALQKSQGYDLSQYAGKTVMRYVYKVNNFPNATEPVYATLLVYKNQVIGGDITDTAAKGVVQGLTKQVSQQEQTAPTESTTANSTTPQTT